MQKARKLSHGCNICTEISQAFVKYKVWNSVYKDSINISDTLVFQKIFIPTKPKFFYGKCEVELKFPKGCGGIETEKRSVKLV